MTPADVNEVLGMLWADAFSNPGQPARWKLLFYLLERFPEWRQRAPWRQLHELAAVEGVAKSRRLDGEIPELLSELTSQHLGERAKALMSEPERCVSWGLCELLCERSLAVVADDPRRALELSNLALTVAQSFPVSDALFRLKWGGSVPALTALCWAHVGNAWRAAGQVAFSATAFESAREAWAEVVIDDTVAAYHPRLLDLEASLRVVEGKCEQAVELLDEVLAYHRGERPGVEADAHLTGRALVSKARALADQLDSPETALDLLSQAERLIDREREPALERTLFHARVGILAVCGRFHEARLLLPRLRALYGDELESLAGLRLQWIEARIARELGDAAAAAVRLEHVAEGFFAAGVVHDASLASLELAAVWLEAGETGRVEELAFRMFAAFQEREEVPREALVSLSTFRAAALQRKLTGSTLSSFADYLERSRKDPSLVFELPGA